MRTAKNKKREVSTEAAALNRAERRALAKERMTRTVDGEKMSGDMMLKVRKNYADRLKKEKQEEDNDDQE